MSHAAQALVLAAGKGTRMGGDSPKVLVEAGGRPLLHWVLDSLRDAGCDRVVTIVGYGRDRVVAALPAGVDWVEQAEQLGTGHAVLCARDAFEGFEGAVLITYGDMPLVTGETYRRLLDAHLAGGAAGTVLTARIAPPHRYGRVVRGPDGGVRRIVEAADATDEELAIDEINTGVYVFSWPELRGVLGRITNDNQQGEYYLPDAVELLLQDGKPFGALELKDAEEGNGVNSPADLERVEAILAARAG
ncbi:MAG: NTP transferase domain-containing protein [Planctomycetota bacterium]